MAIQLPYTDGFITPPNASNYESKDNKGQANGYAPLDGNAKVPLANLPDQASLDAEVAAAVSAHNALTNAHGISNTANLVYTNDSRLSDARTPTSHKATHATNGSDAITPSDIGAQPAGNYALKLEAIAFAVALG